MNDHTTSTSKLDEFLQKLGDQEWVLQLKNKWNDLDSQKQAFIQIFTVIFLLCFFIIYSIYGMVALRSAQSGFAEKTELLTYLKNIQSEIQILNQQTRGIQSETNPPNWENLLKTTLSSQGLIGENIEIKKQKEAPFGSHLKETLFAVQIKDAKLRPLIQGIHALEAQMKPIKVRKINIESKGNKEPVLAVLYVSGFTLSATTGTGK